MKSSFLSSSILVVFVCSLLLSQQLPQLKVAGRATEETNELVAHENRDANGEGCAGLIVATDLDDLKFDAYNGIVKTDASNPGRYLLYLSPEERVVTIYKSGYEPLKIVLGDFGLSKMQSGKVWRIKVTGVTVYVLDSDPLGATVQIDGRVVGETPLKDTLDSGEHLVKIQKQKYEDVVYKISLNKPRIAENRKLTRLKAILKLDTEPTNVRVMLDNREALVTPCEVSLDVGEHTISVHDKYFEDLSKTIDIPLLGIVQKIALVYRRAPYSLVTDPPSAMVHIDGEEMGKTPMNKSVTLRNHHVDVDLLNYDNLSYDIAMDESGIQETKNLVRYFANDVALTIGGALPFEKKAFMDSTMKTPSLFTGWLISLAYLYNINSHLAAGIRVSTYEMDLNGFEYLESGSVKRGDIFYAPINVELEGRWTFFRSTVEPCCFVLVGGVLGAVSPKSTSGSNIANLSGFSIALGTGITTRITKQLAMSGELIGTLGSASLDKQVNPYNNSTNYNPSDFKYSISFSYRWGDH